MTDMANEALASCSSQYKNMNLTVRSELDDAKMSATSSQVCVMKCESISHAFVSIAVDFQIRLTAAQQKEFNLKTTDMGATRYPATTRRVTTRYPETGRPPGNRPRSIPRWWNPSTVAN